MVHTRCLSWKFNHIHIVTYFAHRYYAKEVKRVFYSELQEEQERVFRTAFVGELIQITGENSMIDEKNDKMDRISEASDHLKGKKLSVAKNFLNFPSHDWQEREGYSKDLISKKNDYKEKSILQVHSKRLNVLEE